MAGSASYISEPSKSILPFSGSPKDMDLKNFATKLKAGPKSNTSDISASILNKPLTARFYPGGLCNEIEVLGPVSEPTSPNDRLEFAQFGLRSASSIGQERKKDGVGFNTQSPISPGEDANGANLTNPLNSRSKLNVNGAKDGLSRSLSPITRSPLATCIAVKEVQGGSENDEVLVSQSSTLKGNSTSSVCTSIQSSDLTLENSIPSSPPVQHWIHCFCEVRFDLETGQAIDFVYPPYSLSPDEEKNVAFAAFPDTRVFETGDMVYSFRVRKSSSASSTTRDENSSSGINPMVLDNDFYTGYVYFRQRKDSRVHRGYYQKSLVILTSLPPGSTIGLFTHLATLAGQGFHDFGGETPGPARVFLEATLQDLSKWPIPSYGTTLEVPLAGKVLQVELPDHPGLQLLETSQDAPLLPYSETKLLASVPDGSLPGLLLHWWDRLTDLWTMWELVLLGEPLVVMAKDPATCSQVVNELLDLIKPIPYCGDFRPYLTIQDPDHKSFTNKRRSPANTILGVTNPYFHEALAHWPHWIHLGANPNTHTSLLSSSTGYKGRGRGVVTTHKSLITKDRNLIHHLTKSMLRGDRSATLLNNKLRRYFGELTERFLVPLNRYASTLLPTSWSVAANGKPPQLKPFKSADFFASLESHGVVASSPHTVWGVEIYRHFLKSGNFATWLHARTTQSELELKRRHLAQLCDMDIVQWITHHSEVEVIDLVLKIRQEIDQIPIDAETNNKNINPPRSFSPNSYQHIHSKSADSRHHLHQPICRSFSHNHTNSSPSNLNSIRREQLETQVERILFLLPPDIQAIFKST